MSLFEILRGLLTLLFGLIVLLWPDFPATATIPLFGAVAVADGVVAVATVAASRRQSQLRQQYEARQQYRVPPESRGWTSVELGNAGEAVLGIGVGLVALVWLDLSSATSLYVVGIWAILIGALKFASIFSVRRVSTDELALSLAIFMVDAVLAVSWLGTGLALLATVRVGLATLTEQTTHVMGWCAVLLGILPAVRISLSQVPELTLRQSNTRAWLDPVEIPTPAAAPQPTETVATQTVPPPHPPGDLVLSCANGNCVLYAGAGLSELAGLPAWSTFVEQFLTWAAEQGILDNNSAQSSRAALIQGDLDSVVDGIVAAAGSTSEQLQAFLATAVPNGATSTLSDAHQVLRTIPFAAALTNNLDQLLEKTFGDHQPPVYAPEDATALAEALQKRGFFILKLHGIVARPETLAISEAQLQDKIGALLPFSRFLETLSISRTLVLIGATIEDTERQLRALGIRGRSQQPHYALVSVNDEGWLTRAASLERRYGVSVIPYAEGSEQTQLVPFLNELSTAVQRSTTSPAPAGTRLNRIQVENIGPFDNLDLQFTTNWTILLGDNGVGKSNILRAIALSICGADASRYAGRLLKSSATRGSITLYTNQNVYLTTLHEASPGRAVITSTPGRPLEAENWLAVSFPALRTLSWDRPRSPEAMARTLPSPDDLLAMVAGSVDPRLDSLKQWIVNLDYAIKDAQTRGVSGAAYEKLLKRFFEIAGQLLGDQSIRQGTVDPQTLEVTVTTQDGPVPLEAISQGMTSLLGWVGFLLQRLYEIYGEDDDPTQRYALVLIDEIDAHLHPEWQLTLVEKLSQIFQNAQFIATTHSPLIVAGLPIDQVVRFTRNEDGRVVRVDLEQDMTMGRADQILRGDLFNLRSTMGRRTQDKLARYDELAGKSSRSPEEEAEFIGLEDELHVGLLMDAESAAQLQAQADLLRKLASDIRDEDPDTSRTLVADAEGIEYQLQKRGGNDSHSV